MTETTQYQIDEMNDFCNKLSSHSLIEKAIVDDWGRFGNFSIIIKPTSWTRTTTNQLKSLVKKELTNFDGHLRDCFPPEFTGFDFVGDRKYHKDFWSFDIDHQAYNAKTNQFFHINK